MGIGNGYPREMWHYKPAQTSQGYLQFTALGVYAAWENHQINLTAIAALAQLQLKCLGKKKKKNQQNPIIRDKRFTE